jgi:hypothetical protein
MAFQTGTSTSIENLLQTLSTFLVANGWTQDFATTGDPGLIAFSKNNIFVAFQYTESTDNGVLAIYQNLSNDNSTSVWLSTGDSGNGIASLTASLFDSQRCVNEFAGPHSNYWFFENDSNPAYINVVVEVDAGRFRHFGFGEIDKIGDWVGGEYAYGHYWSQVISFIDVPTASSHHMGLDGAGFGGAVQYNATMRVDGHSGEPDAATVWANFVMSASEGNDRLGNPRWSGLGGWRAGREWQTFCGYRISQATAYTPLVPIPVEVINFDATPDAAYRLGYQADVRLVNIANLDPGQIISIAGDQWYFFPWVRKQYLENNTEESWNGGVAYKRVNA